MIFRNYCMFIGLVLIINPAYQVPAYQVSQSFCNQCQTAVTSVCTTIQNHPMPCCPPASNCCRTTVQNCCCASDPICLSTTEKLIQCPPGSQPLGKECVLIYCPSGTHMVDGRCIVIGCPKGTIWIGNRCSVPEPTVQNITIYNSIITTLNDTKPEIIINHTNNINVNASLTLEGKTNRNKDCDDDCDKVIITTDIVLQSRCCLVKTPRICKDHDHRWRCYSRRSRRCGAFCVAPIIYLRPNRVRSRPHYVVMPPFQNDCELYGNCDVIRGGYDCSGCAVNEMQRCSYYCYRYTCPSQRCDFYDQEMYCTHNVHSYGCREQDGCLDNFCQ